MKLQLHPDYDGIKIFLPKNLCTGLYYAQYKTTISGFM